MYQNVFMLDKLSRLGDLAPCLKIKDLWMEPSLDSSCFGKSREHVEEKWEGKQMKFLHGC